MKMNKRMQSLDAKLQAANRSRLALLEERKRLVDFVRETTPSTLLEAMPDPHSAMSLHVAPRDDEPLALDLPALSMLKVQYQTSQEQQMSGLTRKLKDAQRELTLYQATTSTSSLSASSSVASGTNGEIGISSGGEHGDGPPLHPLDPTLSSNVNTQHQNQSNERIAKSNLESELAATRIQMEEYRDEAQCLTQQLSSLRGIQVTTEKTLRDRAEKQETLATELSQKNTTLEEKVVYLQVSPISESESHHDNSCISTTSTAVKQGLSVHVKSCINSAT